MGTILIGADLVPTESNSAFFEQGDADCLIGQRLADRLRDTSFIVMNLEVPLTDVPSPIKKCGPNLIASTKTLPGIKKINPYFFTLANNHIMDHGEAGLYSTMRVLSENGISFAGAGANLSEAGRPFVRDIGGKRIGIYCCAEHEFSIASESTPGANPYDPLVSFDAVKKLDLECDYLIVLYHGGKEHYQYPSPALQKVFHKFADSGADLIIAQHSHCIGCKEEYNGSTLVYGQGNFLFDHSKNELWKTALLIEVNLTNGEVGFIPVVKTNCGVREADGTDKETILREFLERSEEIKDAKFVRERFEKLADELRGDYLLRFSGSFMKGLAARILIKLFGFGFLKRLYRDEARTAIKNVLDCESHREIASEAMKYR